MVTSINEIVNYYTGHGTEQVSSHRSRHHSQARHRLGPGKGRRQRKQQNGSVDQKKRYISHRNKTNGWTETRGPSNFLTSMTGCSPRHLAANGSYQDHPEEGNSRLTSIETNLNVDKVYSTLHITPSQIHPVQQIDHFAQQSRRRATPWTTPPPHCFLPLHASHNSTFALSNSLCLYKLSTFYLTFKKICVLI